MISFIQHQFFLYFAISAVLFFPGWFLLLAIFRKNDAISTLERFILSIGLSLVVTDFIAFAYSRAGLPINASSAIIGVLIFCAVCFGIYRIRMSRIRSAGSRRDSGAKNLFSFSRNQFILILLLIFLGLFIKTAYLTGTVAPTATDMGHHMYWTQEMITSGQLPTYEGMPDFIIGEHIAMAEIAMISGYDLFSALPVIILLLINTAGILTVFILTLRIFQNKNIAILVLLFLGVLFAVASPQAKFISGGVIGNLMGNLLMPLAFYFYYRAFQFFNANDVIASEAKQSLNIQNNLANHEIATVATLPRNDSAKFLSLAIFSTSGLFYTHHLSAFIFLFVSIGIMAVFWAVNFKNIKEIIAEILRLMFSKAVIITMLLSLTFFFFIFTPTYVDPQAVDTAVGTPEKSTREGLTLTNLKDSVGEARMALGFIGLIVLALSYKRKNFGFAIAASWMVMILIMSTKPHLLLIDLPSSRIGNYLSYPLAILAAYGLYFIFKPNEFKFNFLSFGDRDKLIPRKLISAAFLIVITFTFASGLKDSAEAFKKTPDFTPAIQTFDASKYLKSRVTKDDILLKDHNYITADAWIKLFFMNGYRYPLSRGLFRRYEDSTNPREMCTLHMISDPNSVQAESCFSETGTNFIMVNPRYDAGQFENLKDFDKIYDNGGVATFYRK
jgi:hypothetical protein